MARDGVTVQQDLAGAVASYVDGAPINVARTCRQLQISRKTFYKYVARFKATGVQGFFPDSRRPHHSPRKLDLGAEDHIVLIRKQLKDSGWDYGADAIVMWFEEHPDQWPGGRPVSRSAINRILDNRGQIDKVPQRKPPTRWQRFEYAEVNGLWQMDGFDYTLADGTDCVVLELTDDRSRVDLALTVGASENGKDVWRTFCLAAERYGLPARVLTDNGTAFSGKRRGWLSRFEVNLADLGIVHIASTAAHPQTCGKNERAHGRVRKWLSKRATARTRAELQQLLDTYRAAFNDRRNNAIAKTTPNERFALGPVARPGTRRKLPTLITTTKVTTTGSIGVGTKLVGVGRPHAGKAATVFRTGDLVTVFIDDRRARELIIDHAKRYQAQHR